MVGQRGARQDWFRAGVQLERAAPSRALEAWNRAWEMEGSRKNLPKALEVPSRCGCARVLMLRSVSAIFWRRRRRRRVSAYSCGPDFLAARRLASDPPPGEALMLRVVVSSTSARRQTRPKRLAVFPSGQSPVAAGSGPAPPAAPRAPKIGDHRHTLINLPDPCQID